MAAAAAFNLRPCVNLKLCLFAHLVIFAWYVFTLNANCSIAISERHPGARSYGGRWKYLTFINLVSGNAASCAREPVIFVLLFRFFMFMFVAVAELSLNTAVFLFASPALRKVMQTVFFGLCVVTDLIHVAFPKKSSTFVVTVQDFFFTVLAFPVGTFVFTSFWSIYAYNRELVFPRVLDDIIPTWLNHALHTVILPLLLVQMCLQHHKHPSRCRGILALALFVSLYLAWVLWVRYVSGIWAYPIMAHLSPAGLVVFLSVASISMAPLYLLGEKLNQVIWGLTGNQKQKKK